MQETLLRQNNTHVRGDGFDDHGSDFARMLGEKLFDGSQIVIWNIERELCERLRHAGAFRDTEGCQARSRLRQKAVRMTVVAAFEFYKQVATGKSTSKTEGAHGRFGAT